MGVAREATIYAQADNANMVIDAAIMKFEDLARSIVASTVPGFDDSCRFVLCDGSWIQVMVACQNVFAYEKIYGLYDLFSEAQPGYGNKKNLDLIKVFDCVAVCSFELENEKAGNDVLERLVAVCGEVGGLIMHSGMRLYDGKGNIVY